MNAVVAAPEQQISVPRTNEEAAYSLTVKRARALASSTLVPKDYQGEDNLGNVFIALDIAERIGASPMAVMQNLHIIHGRPGWAATFLIATVNACGRFTPLRFEIDGEDPFDKKYRVRCVAKDKSSGETCVGAWIGWKMVEAEGWQKKTGSKWLSMPEQMFLYRAASFWTRIYAPELSLGIQTVEEVQDFAESRVVSVQRADLSELQDRLQQRALTADAPTEVPEAIDAEAEAESERVLQRDPDTGEVLPPELQG